MFYLMIFNCLVQQWVQDVLLVCLSNCRLFRRDKTFYQRTTKIFKFKLKKSEFKLIMKLLKRYIKNIRNLWMMVLSFGH